MIQLNDPFKNLLTKKRKEWIERSMVIAFPINDWMIKNADMGSCLEYARDLGKIIVLLVSEDTDVTPIADVLDTLQPLAVIIIKSYDTKREVLDKINEKVEKLGLTPEQMHHYSV
jgi:hypothetical protein